MSFKSVLERLFPTLLGGHFERERIVDAAALDAVQVKISQLKNDSLPDSADALLSRWEKLLQITPAPGADPASRRAAVAGKYGAKGDIKKPYFVALAATMGYEIRIDDYTETMAGWLCAGDNIAADPWVYFSAGCAMAGDTLAYEDVILPWIWDVVVLGAPAAAPVPDLETVLQDLKPDHIKLNFIYP